MKPYCVYVRTGESQELNFYESISLRFTVLGLDIQDATAKGTIACTEIRQLLENSGIPPHITEKFSILSIAASGSDVYESVEDSFVQHWARSKKDEIERSKKRFD